MTWILGIDTASTQLDLGLTRDGAPASSYTRHSPYSHAEHIAGAVEFLLKTNGIAPDDITHVAVTAGPGSFTGLRIGISFVKGLLLNRNVPVLPVSSLEAVACAWPAADGTVWVVFEARRGQVFAARFTKESGKVRRLSEDRLEPLASVVERVFSGETVLVDTLGHHRSVVPEAFARQPGTQVLGNTPVQRGLAVARMAWALRETPAQWVSTLDLLPRYLQESAAEVKRHAVCAAGKN